MLGDIKSTKLIIFKGFLFLFAGALAALGVWLESPEWRTAFLLVVAIWCFCRFYYFAFYVLEKYVDPSYKFAGLSSFALYFLKKPRPVSLLPDECHCPCHRGALILHPIECCRICPHCKRRIATAFYTTHTEQCQTNQSDKI